MARFITRRFGRRHVPPISPTCALAHEMLADTRLQYHHRAAGTQLPGEQLGFTVPRGHQAIDRNVLLDELQKLKTQYGFQDLWQDSGTFYVIKLALPASRPTLAEAIGQQIRKTKTAARHHPPRTQ